jgi:hypothetical protein
MSEWTDTDSEDRLKNIKQKARHHLGNKRIIWIKTVDDLLKIFPSGQGTSIEHDADGLEVALFLNPYKPYRFHPDFFF